MGYWGTWTLENDRAQDFMGGIVTDVVAKINKSLKRRKLELDEVSESLAGMLALRALLDIFPPGCVGLTKHVRAWQAKCQVVLDGDFGSDAKFVKGFRNNAEKQFAALLELLDELGDPDEDE